MTPAGHRSPDVASIVRINRVAGMSISYEGAAWDRELVSAATTHEEER